VYYYNLFIQYILSATSDMSALQSNMQDMSDFTEKPVLKKLFQPYHPSNTYSYRPCNHPYNGVPAPVLLGHLPDEEEEELLTSTVHPFLATTLVTGEHARQQNLTIT
jgi:hypothetical protein